MKKTSLAKKTFFFIILFVMMLLATEIGSRILYPFCFAKENYRNHFEQLINGSLAGGYFPTFKPHHYMLFTLREGFKADSGEVLHTGDCFRTPRMSKEKPSDVFRITLLGGSTTYDNGQPYLKTYAAYLEEILQKSFPGRKIEVLNAAAPGYTSAESFSRFHFNVLDYDPDMVIIYHAINDVWPRMFSTDFHCDYRDTRKIMLDFPPPTPVQGRLMRMCYFYRICYWIFGLNCRIPDLKAMTYRDQNLKNSEKGLQNSTTEAFERNISDIIHICNGRKITPVLVTMAIDEKQLSGSEWHKYLVTGVRQHNEAIRRIAANLGVPMYDLERTMPLDKNYFGDICHVNSPGNLKKARLVSSLLVPILEEKFSRRAEPLNSERNEPDESSLAEAEVYRFYDGIRTKITKDFLEKEDK